MGGSDGGGFLALLLFAAGPGAGVAVWMWIQSTYRNRAARYRPEETVHHRLVDLRGDDALVRRFRTRAGSVDGGNELRPEQRASRWRVLESEVEAPPAPHPTADDLADPDGDARPDA